MKIFVTGGAGFIGSNFIRHVLSLNKGYNIVNYDKLTYAGNLANLESVADRPEYSFVKGSICDANAVEEAMRGCDAVVHFAAESHVDRSIYEPAPVIDTNVTGTFIMLQVARKLNIGRFVHISTDEVYGDMAPGAFANELSLAAEQPLFGLQGQLGSPGTLLRADVWIPGPDYALVQQLRAVSIPRKISAADDHEYF
jgi:dTDP-glucose 4,6-dehydratase